MAVLPRGEAAYSILVGPEPEISLPHYERAKGARRTPLCLVPRYSAWCRSLYLPLSGRGTTALPHGTGPRRTTPRVKARRHLRRRRRHMSVSRERAIGVEGGGGLVHIGDGIARAAVPRASENGPWPITYTSFPPVGAVLGAMPAVGVLGSLALGTTRVDGAATGTNVAEAGTGLPSVTEVVPKGGGGGRGPQRSSGEEGRRTGTHRPYCSCWGKGSLPCRPEWWPGFGKGSMSTWRTS